MKGFGLEEAYDMLRVREVLEGLVAGLAAVRATPEQCARLQAVVQNTGQAVTDDDVMRYTALDRQFHELIIEAAGSPQATTALDSLHFPLARFQFQVALVPGRKLENVGEHREVLQAIEARDVDAAERAARAHIRQIRATLERLAQAGSITPVG
jgi:DNA-binding GntR family transcriptional regulator